MAEHTLAEWHDRLDEHFKALRAERDRFSPDSPVFALEHGLDPVDELPDLSRAVRESVATGRLPSHSWLPFVVYAAEIGYGYQGDEYWPVFEGDTPGWRKRGSAGRLYIRKKYEMFAATYGGAKPSGAWAEWFKNIAWPITHAILPTDLQRHLARLLSDYRHAFTIELLEDHESLGVRLAARSSETSARFRKFAENPSLLGLVAASLLLGDEDETSLLTADVLHRIVVDLSHERQAGVWLRDAKRAAVRVRRKGLLSKVGGGTDAPGPDVVDSRWPKLEVELSLRRTPDGWTVYVTVPSHESLAHRFPSIRAELERVRYRIDGSPGVQPRGALMYRQGPLALGSLPAHQSSLLSVEGVSDTLSALLADHCRFPAEPWLFRLREPGLASEVRTNSVRPGQRYVLLTRTALSTVDALAQPAPLTTLGAHATMMEVPEAVNDGIIASLRQMGVGVVSDVSVWPAGLVPASWDGEGRATWPAGESPIIGVRSTRSAAKCVVSTDEDVAEFSWPENANEIFIQVRDPSVGVHVLHVALLGVREDGALAQGQLLVRILEPADSAASASSRQGIQVRAYPPRPTLEELWSGAAAIVVNGPHEERVQFELSLLSRGGRTTLAHASFSSALPVEENRWRELFRGARGDSTLESAFGEAEEIGVRVSNRVLGSAEIRAERPFEPLRWSTGHDREGPYAQLIDHMDSEKLEIDYFDVPTPAESTYATVDEDGRVHTSNGGLVLARAGEFQAAVVLPPYISGGLESLRKLSVRPSLQTGPRSSHSVKRMVDLARLWTRVALPADENAAQLQSQVNDAIVARLSGMIAGSRWWEIEYEVLDGRQVTDKRLLAALGKSAEERRTADRLLALCPRVGKDPQTRAAVFSATIVDRWRSVDDVTEPVLRLATVPGALAAESELTARAVDEVLQRPALYRLARCFALALAMADDESGGSVLREWTWD